MDYPIKTVCVVGLGYIGLPTAATLASRGVEVIGVDINPQVVEAVNAGQPYFSEPDLDMLLRAATTLRKLRATAQPEPADAFVIAVPTPFNADRSPNLDHIDAAADAIAPILASGKLVFCTPFDRVIALDATSGSELWVFDPVLPADLHPANDAICRGVAVWHDATVAAEAACADRVFLGTNDARLIGRASCRERVSESV